MTGWISLIGVTLIVLYAVIIFNRLVSTRQMASEAWSGIDVQLKRRSDLVPNLVETVKGYAAHERQLLAEVTELRNLARSLPTDDVEGRARAEGALSTMIGRLIAVAEAYPDLKASTNFLELQRELAKLEDEIQMARRYYNGAVRNLNTMVETVPSNIVARFTGFAQRAYFELADARERALPSVQV
jgi:LemA protein